MKIKIGTSQFSCIKDNVKENMNKSLDLASKAASQKVNVFLLQELFQTQYFCSTQNSKFFDLAITFPNSEIFEVFSNFCKHHKIVIPISFFEKYGQNYFNSLVLIDSKGELSDIYRKSHIPDGPGYNEKFYFTPGNTGFKVFDTEYGKIGCGICWDQWFPECARSMTLLGADMILYPTAIGSEPQDPNLNSKKHWENVMIGHSAANQIPIISSNRIGEEIEDDIKINFYGGSFITDHLGSIQAQMDSVTEGVISHEINVDEIRKFRQSWGNFRDRRPDLYKKICDF
ncbi:N-carbamoylputrescine amidase [Alphaproteobacteria bacterium]|jgi:N-carbamoylputrescine amidase|nr:N-carbamoylputrescine amidase [Alphaproteobacteria bacterium]OUX23209.1 MAG: N-carbamoylputrescine amidase [Pelagibacteraceae bacterium TMED259]|tara:strand:+ start:1214 stop:2071 length:858 start_codon:yes stop_codon:yes gene_type:complete